MDDPFDAEEYGRWRREADRALVGADAQAAVGIHNWACFGCEQAAQLALKGFLHGVGAGPWGHDLVYLGELAIESGVVVPDDVLDALRRLSRHYIPARYPDAHPVGPPGDHYGKADWVDARRDVGRLLELIDGIVAA